MLKKGLISKLPDVPTSIFAKMSGMAKEYGAINLAQGFPNFPSSPVLNELVFSAIKDGFNQYAPMPGIIELREAIADKIEFLYQKKYNPDSEITITAGATQAIFTIISAVSNQWDVVMWCAPAYDSYAPSILINGGIPVEVNLKPPEYSIPWDQVESTISPKTKMILINSPHNPTGSVLTGSDLLKLQEIVIKNELIVLSDEVYEHIIFDQKKHHSVALLEELSQRSFIVASFGKTFHNTGWKMGYCTAPINLMKEFRKVHQFNVFSVNHPIQRAMAKYLENSKSYLSLPDFYQEKRDYFLSLLKGSRFKFEPAAGTYFQILNYEMISLENDVHFAEKLTSENKVASIPISAFYADKTDQKQLRFCFAKQNETLEQAANILNSL